MKQNKNVVRLTESQLKQMIAESVSNVLNEIGDTRFGQYMLGRTSARQKTYPNSDGVDAFDYAYTKRQDDGLGSYSEDFSLRT